MDKVNNKVSITKYNPNYRNKQGHYRKNEWSSISDIGKRFDGELLTFDEYLKIENLYVKSIFLIFDYFNTDGIIITHLFKISNKKDFTKYDNLKWLCFLNKHRLVNKCKLL